MQHNPLGQSISYKDTYDPSLLFRIARKDAREKMGLRETLPFTGKDYWKCYELLWLDSKGIPQSASMTLSYACESQFIVESKSLKLYLGSFHNTIVGNEDALKTTIQKDLSDLLQTDIQIAIEPWQGAEYPGGQHGTHAYVPFGASFTPAFTFTSHSLRSICPVTGQPDTGTVIIQTSKKILDENNLLAYITSLRNHQDYHESCAEKIFMDIRNQISQSSIPDVSLWLGCFYARRGGIAICPVREG